jgi:hypothetical protein
VEHGESGGDAAHRNPDGPTPAREQLPLPQRRRQSHLEPQLRTPGGAGTGTPFAAFSPPPLPDPPAPTPAPASAAPTGQADRTDRAGRAAAFRAGTRRGRGTGRPRRGNAARRPEQSQPNARPTEH